MSFFDKLKASLTKTRDTFFNQISSLFRGRKIDESFFEELEEMLIMADVGVKTTMELLDKLRKEARQRKLDNASELLPILEEQLSAMMKSDQQEMNISTGKPTVWMIVGVNGVGKTTTIAKLAYQFKQQGKTVMLAAGDTFRAGAIEQLKIWGERVQCPVVAQSQGSDPAAVLFDAVQAARSSNADILICDTAGRLHNKTDLMNELNKMYRILKREIPDAPHEVLLVVDATTGQNAIHQAKVFSDVTNVTGIALTKLDSTAKGGVVIAIQQELGIPVKWIGLGEKMTDLDPFKPSEFVHALFE